MKTQIILLRIAGCIALFFMLFHLAFAKIFNWPDSLSCLSVNNRAILLTYHYISILILAFMAYIGLVEANNIIRNSLRYSLLSFFSLFFLIRIVTEFTLFGYNDTSLVILILCILPLIFFAIPLFYNNNKLKNENK